MDSKSAKIISQLVKKLKLGKSLQKEEALALKIERQQHKQQIKEMQAREKLSQGLARALFLQQELDRKEISRELHGEISQILTGINFGLEVLSKEAENSTIQLRSKITETQKLVEDSVDSIHRFARELRPMILDDLGLGSALKSYLKFFGVRTSIKVSFSSVGSIEKITNFKKTVLFRVAQEALANVARHSKARHVYVSIQKKNKMVEISIRDNGRGFKVPKAVSVSKLNRIGLVGMCERIKLVEGKIHVKSKIGRGTTITANVPFGGDSENYPTTKLS